MAGDRYVILGLAHPRAVWFRTVAQWANASSIPVELVKCLSAEELRARLVSGRAFSAAIVDARVAALDRDLLDEMSRAGCPTLVVEDRRRRTDWLTLGAAAVLPDGFDRDELLRALAAHGTAIASGDDVPGTIHDMTSDEPRGTVIAVCGPGGTGASTVAIALCQGLAEAVWRAPGEHGQTGSPTETGGRVILADLKRNAEQSMLHDAGDIVPGVQELVEAHRNGQPRCDAIMALTFLVEERGYHLLLGLRRSSAWAALRPRGFEAGIASLCDNFATVVADVDADVEGERDGGSLEVEERNVMSRTALSRADVVLVVGAPGMKGIHSLARVVGDLLGLGVPGSCVVPVLNRSPRSRRSRAELTAALAALIRSGAPVTSAEQAGIASPIFLPERRIEECLRDGVRLPGQLTTPLTGAVRAVLERRDGRTRQVAGPEPVAPGSIGHWGAEAEEALG
ncbi:MAG: ParA family protein [Actinobacteria bacterium]|nr:MAG: ParA family protein [Actinomycetota bacterium]